VSMGALCKISCLKQLADSHGIRASVLRCGFSIDSQEKFIFIVEEEESYCCHDDSEENKEKKKFDSSFSKICDNNLVESVNRNLRLLQLEEDWDADG